MTISEYKLIKYGVQKISQLEQDVNDLINIGWQPIGEVKLVVVDGQQVLIQQMQKSRKNDKK